MTSIEGSSNGIVDDHTPLWKYATKVKKYCLEILNESNSRVKAHLMRISG